jgi:hypothetical protein
MAEYYDKLFTLSREKFSGQLSVVRCPWLTVHYLNFHFYAKLQKESKPRTAPLGESAMNRFRRSLGKVCDNCPLCNYARGNPETVVGKVMIWHGRYCPAWKAQKEIVAEWQEQKRRDGE